MGHFRVHTIALVFVASSAGWATAAGVGVGSDPYAETTQRNADPAAAQERPAAEIGVGGSGVPMLNVDFFTDGRDLGGPDVRITLPFTPRFSFESLVTLGSRRDGYNRRLEGFYLFQVKQRLRSATRGRFHAFLTYGGAGYYAQVWQPETQIPVVGGGTITRPARTYNEVDPPLAAVPGVGVQHAVARHLAVRLDAQLITILYYPVGGRFSASVSIPFSAYPTPHD
jgi:hypothetical protein